MDWSVLLSLLAFFALLSLFCARVYPRQRDTTALVLSLLVFCLLWGGAVELLGWLGLWAEWGQIRVESLE